MNPFKITTEEYNENFGEKKNFLKSLIFLIYKRNVEPTMTEDRLINQCIVEYYEEYFHPFQGYSKEERDRLRERLMLEDKMNGEYEKYEQKLEEKYSDDYRIDELEDKPERRARMRRCPMLQRMMRWISLRKRRNIMRR